MRLLRPNIPLGVSVWRTEPGGPIVEAAFVSPPERFVWCGLESRTPPATVRDLETRPGRTVFELADTERSEASGGPAYLERLVATGVPTGTPLQLFRMPEGDSLVVEAGAAGEPIDLEWCDRDGFKTGPAWDDPALFPVKESARLAKYRRHQSWYRANVLRTEAGSYGRYEPLESYLQRRADPVSDTWNFLTAEAEEHAVERASRVRVEVGSLDPSRLFRNMLSSMPLCFNLFGSLRKEPAFLSLFQRVFDQEATEIVDVVCEFAPQPPEDFLDDRTAFDALIRYRTADGPHFRGCGDEVHRALQPDRAHLRSIRRRHHHVRVVQGPNECFFHAK